MTSQLQYDISDVCDYVTRQQPYRYVYHPELDFSIPLNCHVTAKVTTDDVSFSETQNLLPIDDLEGGDITSALPEVGWDDSRDAMASKHIFTYIQYISYSWILQ